MTSLEKCQKCSWQIVEIGLFRFLVSDSVATFGTINESQEWNDKYNRNAFRNPSSTNFHVEIPNTITYNDKTYPVTVIGHQALRYSKITSLRIPRNIQIILSYAIDYCSYMKYIYFDPDSMLRFIDNSFCVGSLDYLLLSQKYLRIFLNLATICKTYILMGIH